MKTTCMRLLTLVLCALAAGQASAQGLKIKPGVIKGETVSFTKARNYEFCELYRGSGPVNASTQLECYNSTGTSIWAAASMRPATTCRRRIFAMNRPHAQATC